MSNNETAEPKAMFSKSLGSGVRSILGGGGRTYYVLEHRTHSKKHKAGDVSEIIVDYIELGRDGKCQVRFGDDMPTVSRRHAAIVKEGDRWVVKNLSSVNQTLINNRPVSRQWFLESGDELQLSAEGPKMGFIVPQNNTLASLGLSRRLSLFRQQALQPYKTAIAILAVLLMLGTAAGGYGIYTMMHKVDLAETRLEEVDEELTRFRDLTQHEADSLKQQLAENERLRRRMESRMTEMEGTMTRMSESRADSASANPSSSVSDDDFTLLYPSVYQVYFQKFTIAYEGETSEETVNSPIGSAFLLSDGRFVTARHVVEPWSYADESDHELLYINALVQMGAVVTARFKAISPSGTSFSFTNNDVLVDRSRDQTRSFTDEEGTRLLVRLAPLGSTDWARIQTSYTGGLRFNAELSNNLRQRTQLDVLGYPLGMAARSGGNISPIYGSCTVGATGLQNGIIVISARNFEQGNSGGPVFIEKDGKHYVVGIISAGTGDGIGFIVPISTVR